MARFLIEVPHESTKETCARAVEVFLKTGSHFFTHADWGCKDGEHKAWIVVEVDSKDEARAIVPPAFRSKARSFSSTLSRWRRSRTSFVNTSHNCTRSDARSAA
jgi:hypothetical protein